MKRKRPPITRELLDAAAGNTVADIIGPNLKVLFCGINPGLYSGAVGHHFAHPSNRFWPVLQRAGYTEKLLSPFEDRSLLDYGYGLTNFVERASARGSDLTRDELIAGGRRLIELVAHYRPAVVAFLGIGAYRKAYAVRKVSVGQQPQPLGQALSWVLPNPSGLNAHYSLERMAELYRDARLAAERELRIK